MKSLKEKALDKILLGVSLKLIPLASLGLLYPDLHENSNYDDNLASTLSLLTLISLLVGYVIFVKGCFLYIESKGYSSKWGWLGIFSLLILPIFFFLPSKRDKISVQSENSENASFKEINIPEISLFIFIGIPLLIFIISLIFFSDKDLTKSTLIQESINIIIVYPFFVIALLAEMEELKFDINQIIGIDNSINLKSILVITIMAFAFNISLSSLMLYQLSFIFPKYVEDLINDRSYTNLLEMVLWCFSIMFFAPLIEEFFFRGVVMQKWVLKWGIKTGIITSSLFFALIHFRFDIIPLFVLGCILSILYFRNHNLISPIISHFFYNTLVAILNTIDFFLTPETERNVFVSVETYQNHLESLLGQIIFMIAVSAPFVIYFIYKNFPKNNAIIPYYANSDKIHETN